MDITPKKSSGEYDWKPVDTFISDNYCCRLYCRLLAGNFDFLRDAKNCVLYDRTNGDPFKIFTNHDEHGYAASPVRYLGFLVDPLAPPEEFHWRIDHVLNVLGKLGNDDETDDTLMQEILANIIQNLDLKHEVTVQTLENCNKILHVYTDKSGNPLYGVSSGHLTTLKNTIALFDAKTGKRVDADGQQTLNSRRFVAEDHGFFRH